MRDQIEKKPYTPPKVVRVKLRHEQAVLSACSTLATTNSDLGGDRCSYPSGGSNCRKASGAIGGVRDSRLTT